jgi:CheY-like chemotaxis protein
VKPRKRILIVEDDADLRRLFRTRLAVEGFEIEETGNGLDALRNIENRAPDLVVLDLILPGLDGISVSQEIAARAITNQIPVVVVTGSTLSTATLQVACVLKKPVDLDDLVRVVRQCLVIGASREIV